MPAEPGGERAAAAAGRGQLRASHAYRSQLRASHAYPGQLRASHADREYVVDTVKTAFVQGRLTKDELDVRVGQVLAARTYADLAALTADLPGGLPGVLPLDETTPAHAQPAVNKALLWSSWAVLLLITSFMVGAFPADFLGLLAVGAFPLLIVAPLAVALSLDSWRQKRTHGLSG